MLDKQKGILKSILERIQKSDRIIWVVIVILAISSLVFIFSTTAKLGTPFPYMMRQLKVFGVCFGLIVFLHFVHYRVYTKVASIGLLIAFVLLVIAQFAGDTINDANRWLTIPGVGFSFQPSELAKIALVLYVARTLSRNQTKDGCKDIAFKQIMIPTAAILLLIFKDDFSTAVLLGVTVLVMMFIGRIATKYLLYVIGGAVLVGGLTIGVALGTDARPDIGRVATILNRTESFFNEDKLKEQDKDKYLQIDRAKAAVSTGGLLGKGPGNSNVRYVLPHPYSDFIFAIIIEEGGLIVGLLLILLYLTLMFRAGEIVKRCTRTFPAFLVTGLMVLIVMQAFTNMAVAVNLIPVTGQPLPFISMGGTSLLMTGMAFGMILSITYTLKKIEEDELQAA